VEYYGTQKKIIEINGEQDVEGVEREIRQGLAEYASSPLT
jgi:hypothetical protein